MGVPRVGEVWLDLSAEPLIILGELEVQPELLGIEMARVAKLTSGHGSGQWSVAVLRSPTNGLDVDMHVDCRSALCSASSPSVRIGSVNADVIKEIDDVSKRMFAAARRNMVRNRFSARSVEKYDYDVALSFSGADRRWANELADRLSSKGLRVFHDEYEAAAIWGQELVQHLDEVYRKRARYCIVLASASYAASIWTNHELKSALARSLTANEEYLLPVRLDDTELPGLRPTVGYLTLKSSSDVEMIAEMTLKKMGRRNLVSYAEFSSKWVQNVLEINKAWGIDCLAFCIDPRFTLDAEGLENRIAISYGVNLTSPRIGWLQPSERHGENVFGLHHVGIHNEIELSLRDRWLDALPATSTDELEHAVSESFRQLSLLDDSRYTSLTSHSATIEGLYVSDRYLLDEFDVRTEFG